MALQPHVGLSLGRKESVALILVLLALLWFAGLEYRALFKPDEGRYADIARTMLDTGDWITPRLNGLKYFEKPPLQYWATAAAYGAFGVDEWTTRLWSAGLAFLGILFSGWAAPRLWPGQSGLRVMLVLASAWGYFVAAQVATLDMGLSFFLYAALLSFLLAMRSAPDSAQQRRWVWAMWAAMALAVLSKGLVGIVLPALALFVHTLLERNLNTLKRLHWLSGLSLFLLIAAPWFILVQRANPEFFHFFFIREHVERYLLPDHHRLGPWWYFFPVLAFGLLPWTSAALRAMWYGWRQHDAAFGVDRLLVIWILSIVAFFSLSESKLPAYVLPVLPAMLILVARHIDRFSANARREPIYLSVALGLLLCVLGFGLHRVPAVAPLQAFVDDYQPWLSVAGAVLLVGAFCAWHFSSKKHLDAYLLSLGIASLLSVQLVMSGLHMVDEYYSSERLIEHLNSENHTRFHPEIPFYSVRTFDHTVPFYLGRPVTLVAWRGELAFGIAEEPGKYVQTLDQFKARWRADPQAYAIMTDKTFDELKAERLPMQVIDRDVRRVLVARH